MLTKALAFSLFLVGISGSKPNFNQIKSKDLKDTKQKLTCYEFKGQGGDSVVLTDYAPILDNYNFNNRAAGCCFDGM